MKLCTNFKNDKNQLKRAYRRKSNEEFFPIKIISKNHLLGLLECVHV